MCGSPRPQHAHAAMHCNLNTVDLSATESFYRVVAGVEPRFRSIGTDQDATMMGLGRRTSSVTAFVWDERGPRAAPALELVGWSDPGTVAPLPGDRAGFAAIGYRVPDLEVVRPSLTALGATSGTVVARGRDLDALLLTDPDGVPVEVVEIGGAEVDGAGPALAYERLDVTDLARSLAWYAFIGFSVVHRADTSATIALPEDPTFTLELAERPHLAPSPDRANEQGLYRIALAVEDVDEAAGALRALDPETPDPVFIPMVDTPTGGFTVLFLRDPDGTVVELVARPRSEVRRPLRPV